MKLFISLVALAIIVSVAHGNSCWEGEGAPSPVKLDLSGHGTWQSSTYIHFNNLLYSQYATDGTRNNLKLGGTDVAVETCAHTLNNDAVSWWAVDLGRSRSVNTVVFWPRQGTIERMKGFSVLLTNSPPWKAGFKPEGTACGTYQGDLIAHNTAALRCAGGATEGRYLVIRLPSPNYLELCEVEVYAAPLARDIETGVVKLNVAKAMQSSTHTHLGLALEAKFAVDGNYNNDADPLVAKTCTHTQTTPAENEWWAADLGQPHRLDTVVITTREGLAWRQAGFIVGVTNVNPAETAPVKGSYKLCGQYSGAPTEGNVASLACETDDVIGRYVIFQHATKEHALELCEIDLYGGE